MAWQPCLGHICIRLPFPLWELDSGHYGVLPDFRLPREEEEKRSLAMRNSRLHEGTWEEKAGL